MHIVLGLIGLVVYGAAVVALAAAATWIVVRLTAGDAGKSSRG